MHCVPIRLARDRLEDVRVDLRQRVVTGDAAERIWEARIDARVVQRVTGLVHESLVVGKPALRARDQVHDVGRIRCDHARARILLRPVLEVEANVGNRGHIEAERLDGRHAHVDRALLRICRLERRQPAQVVHVRIRRQRVALRPEELLEPCVTQTAVRLGRRIRGGDEHLLELPQRDRLLLLVARDGIALTRELALELLAGDHQRQAVAVEAGRLGTLQLAERLAVRVGVEHGEACLRRAQRHLFAVERDTGAEDRILERVLLLRELGRDETALARLAQPVEPLPLVAGRGVLGFAQRLDLRAREELAVARDDRSLLRDLLFAHAHGTAFLGALEVVLLKLCLVLGGCAGGGGGHGPQRIVIRHS
jgi:hypothetical protein